LKISKKENRANLNIMAFYGNDDVFYLSRSFSEGFCKKPSNNSRKVRRITDLILLLISNGLYHYPEPFGISISSGVTLKGQQYSSFVLRKVVNYLVKREVINYKKGYSFKGNVQNSQIVLVPSFLKSYKEELATAKQDKGTRRVFIRDKNKEDMFKEYNDNTFMSQVFLNKYEDFLISNNVLLDGLPLTVSPIYRIFNGDEDHGGRLYGKWTNLPKETRKRITIGGEGLAEIDLKACTLSIACHLNGIELDRDPYDFGVKRDVAKKAMIIMFYSQTEIRAKRAIAGLGAVNGFKKGELFTKCVNHLEEKGLKGIMMKGEGLSYIKKESDFCIDVVNTCIEQKVVVLSIHDAFLCRVSDVDKLQNNIDITYLKCFKRLPECHRMLLD
jgi:hypothetical protein